MIGAVIRGLAGKACPLISRRRGSMVESPKPERASPWAHGSVSRLVNAAICTLLLLCTTVAQAETTKLLALGDSLTAGFGLPAEQGFTTRLQTALQAGGRKITVINAGISGDTTAGGLARLDWSLADHPD